MEKPSEPIRNPRTRGAAENPKNRFVESFRFKDIESWIDPEDPSPSTRFFPSRSKTVFSRNDSPDVGASVTFNPYRGCEHGCIYCYARPTHETFGFSAGLDFETKILVKEDAPALLRKELSSPKWTPQTVMMGSVTDCYQPVERRLGLTRRCLETFLEFRNPVFIVTKNFLVTRDADILSRLAFFKAAGVFLSVTSLDASLAKTMEPRTSPPKMRLKAIEVLAKAGVPVGVNVAPVVPGLTDHEVPMILKAAKEAGAKFAGYTIVRLPYGVKDLFEDWLGRHFPDRKEKALSRIRSMRDGKLNDANFHSRMEGKGLFAEQIGSLFHTSCKKYGLNEEYLELSTGRYRRDTAPDLFNS